MVNKILIDCDGVLTDSKVWYNQTGERMKAFNVRDIRSIRELISHGFEVYIITASSWPGMNDFSKRTGAEIIVSREKDVVKLGFAPGSYIAVGDDTPDMLFLKNAYKLFCPSDADEEVLAMSRIFKLNTKGGNGVIAELVRRLS